MRFWGCLIFVVCSRLASAQYSNSWIDFSQDYFRIGVARDGLYRLTFQDLKNAGVPVESIDPRLIQLVHRGEEQAIHFRHSQTTPNGIFEDGEYFEFYGRKNDGTRDATLYQPATAQPHKYYNLYSDTTAYFLTWNSILQQGKRMETIDLVNATNLPKEPYQLEQRLSLFTNEYAGGQVHSSYVQQSSFDTGEGWTSRVFCDVSPDCQQDIVLESLTHRVPTAGVPQLEVLLVGRHSSPHQVEVRVGKDLPSLRVAGTAAFVDYHTQLLQVPLEWSDFSIDGKLTVRLRANGNGALGDRVSVSYVKVIYQRDFDLDQLTEKNNQLRANPLGKSYVEWQNAANGTRVFDVTNPDDVALIQARTTGSVMSAVVPNTLNGRSLHLTSQPLDASAVNIKKVTFRAINPAQPNFLVVSHPSLMKAALGYPNVVKAYAGYRASPEGGSFDTLTVTVDQLYNQFNYGETSASAIYEFMRYMVAEGSPKYLFLIGKGREVQAGFHRKSTIPASEFKDLVPTAGTPGSDMLYTAGLSGDPHIPAVATGRLTASSPAQVAAYLNKIKETEATPFQELWRKKILHLSGGIKPEELVRFRTYMDGFASTAKGLYLGGQVSTVGKHDPNAVQFIDVTQQVNEGVNMVTFFGHSATNTTDIDIGFVTEPLLKYNNDGRYPAFLVNGCNAGEFFNNGTNFGEDWVMASNKGARSFIANSSFALEWGLRLYTDVFYQIAYGDEQFLNAGIGEVQQEVGKRLLGFFTTPPPVYIAQLQQMVLLGDPALRLFASAKPDFETSNESIYVASFDGKPLHALADSLEVNVIVRNPGRAVGDSLRVRVDHTSGENTTTHLVKYASVWNTDTLKFTLLPEGGNFFGNNTVRVSLDHENLIEELEENNNTAEWSSYIPFNGTRNLMPTDFGISPSREVELVFQNTDILTQQAVYFVEIDSVVDFNSPFLQRVELAGSVLNRVNVNVAQRDSVTYYWRTKVKDLADAQWQTSSFTFLEGGSPGWAQADEGQFKGNQLTGLVNDASAVTLDFLPTEVSVFVKTFGSENGTSHLTGSFQVNSSDYYFSPQTFKCRDNTVNLVAFDRSTVVPYLGIPFTYFNSFGRSCGREPQVINSFTSTETDTGNGDDLIQYVNSIKQGDSVIIFSMGDAGFANWTSAAKQKMEELGVQAADIDLLLPGEPVIILARKGALPGTARIIKSDQPDPAAQELQWTGTLSGRFSSGVVRGPVIGPSLRWRSFVHQFAPLQNSDSVRVDIHGIAPNGVESLLLDNALTGQSLEHIDVAAFPFLRLVYHTLDSVNLTPAALRHWIVTYDPVPEGLVFLRSPLAFASVPEGAPWSADFGFVNFSATPFTDSLAVEIQITNTQNGTREVRHLNILGPPAGDSTLFTVRTTTKAKVGVRDIRVDVNKERLPELYYPNNAMTLVDYLKVTRDNTSPAMEVTVDGRHLRNGDFVSPHPEITVRLVDENAFLPLDDPNLIQLLLQSPCEGNCVPTTVNFSEWSSSADGNKLLVAFRLNNLADGEYTLFVRGEDASGNASGEDHYEVTFAVMSEPTVQFYPPYPNPSSDHFFLEFQVSGEDPPTGLLLRVFNAQGQHVAEFTETDLPPMHLGLNRLKWDTRTEGGSTLPGGLYYYKVSVQTTDEILTNTGKFVLVR